MELAHLIDELSRPDAWPEKSGPVEVRQTHISAVFLSGSCVYKLKKPVKLGFLDFSTLEARKVACFDEVRLNRRLAPDVYLGVSPVVRGASGLSFEGEGEPVDWAVKMRRLPDEASLLAKLGRGELTRELIERVAARLAAFHVEADRPASAREFGGLDAVAKNARDNFDDITSDVGTTVSPTVFEALRERSEEAIVRLGPLIARRAERGAACEGHGDLRLEHIYSFPDREPPNDLLVIDCVEFSERLRVGDPVSDVAFTVMELLFHGERELAAQFVETYFAHLGEQDSKELLPFYVAYRSLVRAKVRGIEVREKEIPEDRRRASRARARAHCLLALGELENAKRRPLLALVGGLPGTGKSTLARGLASGADCEVIRSDVVRKEQAKVPADPYSREEKSRTYEECLRRAERSLLEGGRVIVDATFGEEHHRRSFLDLAHSLAIPAVWFVCRASPECVRDRLAARTGDVSDANWSVYENLRGQWEVESHASRRALVDIDTEMGAEQAVARALGELVTRTLC